MREFGKDWDNGVPKRKRGNSSEEHRTDHIQILLLHGKIYIYIYIYIYAEVWESEDEKPKNKKKSKSEQRREGT